MNVQGNPHCRMIDEFQRPGLISTKNGKPILLKKIKALSRLRPLVMGRRPGIWLVIGRGHPCCLRMLNGSLRRGVKGALENRGYRGPRRQHIHTVTSRSESPFLRRSCLSPECLVLSHPTKSPRQAVCELASKLRQTQEALQQSIL